MALILALPGCGSRNESVLAGEWEAWSDTGDGYHKLDGSKGMLWTLYLHRDGNYEMRVESGVMAEIDAVSEGVYERVDNSLILKGTRTGTALEEDLRLTVIDHETMALGELIFRRAGAGPPQQRQEQEPSSSPN
jgi:hypothetical protein